MSIILSRLYLIYSPVMDGRWIEAFNNHPYRKKHFPQA